MERDFVCQGRNISTAELDWLRQAVAIHSDWSRKQLARELRQRWQWRTAQGRSKDFAARSLLLKLHTRGLVVLPPFARTVPDSAVGIESATQPASSSGHRD